MIKQPSVGAASLISDVMSANDKLRNTECSQKQKIMCFQFIADCILSPAVMSHSDYGKICSTATNVLLFFCEDLDSVVRMSAEENLCKIFRSLERTKVNRILTDLLSEIKRNGNQKSLRICLNMFAYYAPQIKERNVNCFALKLLPCIQNMAKRKEQALQETLSEFIKSFGINLQIGLTDRETCKILEVFLDNLNAECVVKRRCSSQNCITLIEYSRNKTHMANFVLRRAIELLLVNNEANRILGTLGLFRSLLPLIIRGFPNHYHDDDDENAEHDKSINLQKRSHYSLFGNKQQECPGNEPPSSVNKIKNDCKQILEIYDFCLYLISSSPTSNHSLINASLEVLNSILQTIANDTSHKGGSQQMNQHSRMNSTARILKDILGSHQLKHNEYLQQRKSLKNQIFQLQNNDEVLLEMAKSVVATPSNSLKAKPKTSDRKEEKVNENSDRESNTALGAPRASPPSTALIRTIGELQTIDDVNEACAEGLRALRQNIEESNGKEKHLKRHSARSISECLDESGDGEDNDEFYKIDVHGSGDVVASADIHFETPITNIDVDANSTIKNIVPAIDVNANAGAAGVAGAGGAVHNDEKDDDDFTTFSEINEPQKSFALTTNVDVDNLIDAIANHTKDTSSKLQQRSEESFVSASTSLDYATKTNRKNKINDFGENLQENLLTIDLMSSPTLSTSSSLFPLMTPEKTTLTDDKLQLQLSDLDNESFNSIDFESEITIRSSSINRQDSQSNISTEARQPSKAGSIPLEACGGEYPKSSNSQSQDGIGSFFNNLISHSNAATESVSKLFKSTSSQATAPKVPDKFDTISMSSGLSNVLEISTFEHSPSTQSNAGTTTEETGSQTHSATASTALMADTDKRHNSLDQTSYEDLDVMESPATRVPNVNPFDKDRKAAKTSTSISDTLAPLIGTLYEQSLIFYTMRLTAARLLLTGHDKGLKADSEIRVSIKNMALNVVSQCVRLDARVLQISLFITDEEKDQVKLVQQKISFNEISEMKEENLEKLEVSTENPKNSDLETKKTSHRTAEKPEHLLNTNLLLDIKDDHFGPSNSDYLLQSSLSQSVDTALSQQMQAKHKSSPSSVKSNAEKLSQSDIVSSDYSKALHYGFEVTQVAEDLPPETKPPRPPKRSKSLKKKNSLQSLKSNGSFSSSLEASPTGLAPELKCQQNLKDILLYYKHSDPVLRGGVQQIIGNFLQASGAGLFMQLEINLQQLLAILIRGLQDEIHTVVIQALNAFDKIFPHVLSKYMTVQTCHYQEQIFKVPENQEKNSTQIQEEKLEEEPDKRGGGFGDSRTLTCPRMIFYDNDELIVALLDAFNGTSCMSINANPSENNFHYYSNNKNYSNDVKLVGSGSPIKTLTTKETQKENSIQGKQEESVDDEYGNRSSVQFKDGEGNANNDGDGDGDGYGIWKKNEIEYENDEVILISPKLLLNKLRLCHYNKYWLVQNKYAEVISNLNYFNLYCYYQQKNFYYNKSNKKIRKSSLINKEERGGCHSQSCKGFKTSSSPGCVHYFIASSAECDDDEAKDDDDFVSTYQNHFLNELIQQLSEEDVRVREHATECIIRFIIKTAQQQKQLKKFQTNKTSINVVENLSTDDGRPDESGKCSRSYSHIGDYSYESKINNKLDNDVESIVETHQSNLNLLWDFFNYRLFNGMSVPLRNLCKMESAVTPSLMEILSTGGSTSSASNLSSSSLSSTATSGASSSSLGLATSSYGSSLFGQSLFESRIALTGASHRLCVVPSRQLDEEEKLLAKVLYRITNKLMVLNDKNTQVGIIYAVKVLLKYFNFFDFNRAWAEFNFLDICQKLSTKNLTTALDLNAQIDLIEIITTLTAGNSKL